MAVLIVLVFLVVLGVVSALGFTVDSRDPDYRLVGSARDNRADSEVAR